jgi:hypothetical protein
MKSVSILSPIYFILYQAVPFLQAFTPKLCMHIFRNTIVFLHRSTSYVNIYQRYAVKFIRGMFSKPCNYILSYLFDTKTVFGKAKQRRKFALLFVNRFLSRSLARGVQNILWSKYFFAFTAVIFLPR